MKLAQVIDERIQYAQDQRPNAAQGLIIEVRPQPGAATIYKVGGYHPGGREPFTCYSTLPQHLSQGMPALQVGTPVLVEIPQGAVESGKIVAVLDLTAEEQQTINSTKDTSPTQSITKAAPNTVISNTLAGALSSTVLGNPTPWSPDLGNTGGAQISSTIDRALSLPSTGKK